MPTAGRVSVNTYWYRSPSFYDGFKLNIPSKKGTPDDWSLPLSATYVIGSDGRILFADTSVDYHRRTDPLDVLQMLESRAAAA